MRISDWSSDVCSSDLHAADGTGAGMVLPDFGVHRAGPDRPRRGIHHPVGRRDQIMFWIDDEFRAAVRTTKLILMAGLGCMMRRLMWIDSHAEHGIDHQEIGSAHV